MTTKVLTENQVNGMKENGVTVICNGCGVEAAKDKTLPTTSWLISCNSLVVTDVRFWKIVNH